MNRSRKAISTILALALLASACGGSDEPVSSSDSSASTSNAVNLTTPLVPTEPNLEESVPLAQQLIDGLGDDETASTALLTAAEHGYSRSQILEGVESSSLGADGTIRSMSPASSALERIDVSGGEQQSVNSRSRPFVNAIASFQQDGGDKLLIDQLRETAEGALTPIERESIVGLRGTLFIITLLRAGASPEQVIDALVLGLYFFEDRGRCFTQSFPLSTPPVERQCDIRSEEPVEEEPQEQTPEVEEQVTEDEGEAVYRGEITAIELADSSIEVTISADGVVRGELKGTEQLENYIASIEVLCGLFADDEAEREEDCADSIVECPATVLWHSDLEGLTFTGDAPDSGTVTGTISLIWDTTPDGCDEPSSETNPVGIEATVSPDAATITEPFVIELERVG